MGLKVFLTGVSGYLGNLLAVNLMKLPEIESITGVYNNTTPNLPSSSKVKLVKMDIRSPDLVNAVSGHEIFIHTAFVVLWLAQMPVSVRDDINLNGIRNLALAAVKNKVRCFIYASSVCAYEPEFVRGKDCVKEEYPIGKGASPIYYCNSKAIAEKILREFIGSSGVKLTIFRPCIIVGPHDHVIVRNFRENAAKFLGRDPRLQFVHEDDVAAAFLQAIHTNMPGAYNVVPDDFIRLSDVYEAIGLKFVLTLPLCLARFVTAIRWRFFGSSLHSSWLDCAVSDTTYSNAKLKATGWYPRHTSAQALHTAIERFETLSM